MIKRNLILFLLSTIAFIANAQQISMSEAAQIAKTFWTKPSTASKLKGNRNFTPKLSYTAEKNGKALFYVFNNANSNGFVIVGCDKNAQRILGYSNSGSFNYATAPENVKWWLSQYETQILEGATSTAGMVAKTATATTKTDVEDIIKTKWNQTYPFNKAIPTAPGYEGKIVTGCVATAMSQIMKKYEYPDSTGFGQKEFQKIYNENDTVVFSADFSNTYYDWSNMKDSYNGSFTEEEADAVATLMYHAGVALNMDYDLSSGAKDMSLGTALIDNFGYDKGISYINRVNYSDEDWTNTIYSELVAGRPVYYSGNTGSVGHGFILHGYNAESDLFSINWGWGGYCDGQFTINGSRALTPGGTGSGGGSASASYNHDQSAILGIRPDVGNDYVWIVSMLEKYPYSMIVDGNRVNQVEIDKTQSDKNLKFSFAPFNKSLVSNTFSFGLQFYDEDTKQSKVYENIVTNQDLAVNGGISVDKNINTSALEFNGFYKVYPVFRTASSNEWKRIAYPNSWTLPTVVVKNGKTPEKINIDFKISGTAMKEETSVVITYNKNYTGKVTCTADTADIVDFQYGEGFVTVIGKNHGTVNVTVKGEAQGYYLETERTFEITVTEVPVVPVAIEINGSEIAVGENLQITHDPEYKGEMTYSVEPEGIVSIDENGVVTGLAEGSAIITATAEGTRFFTKTSAYFDVKVYDVPKSVYITNVKIHNNGYITSDGDEIEVTLKNNSGKTISRQYAYCLIKGGSANVSLGVSFNNFHNGDTYTVKFPFTSFNNGAVSFAQWLSQYAKGATEISFTIADQKSTSAAFYPSEKSIFTLNVVDKLEVTHEIDSTGWGTMMVPFEASMPSGVQVFSCHGYEDKVLNLTEVSSLNMDTPYIIKGEPGTYTFSGPDIPNKFDTYSSGLLVGTTKNDTIPANSYMFETVDSVSSFIKVLPDSIQNVKAYGVYLTLPEDGIITERFYLNPADVPEDIPEEEPIVGDVNDDKAVDISDINAIINVICGGEPNDAADVNKDGAIDISDINFVIGIICGN